MVLLKSPKSFQICVKNLLNHIKPLFLGGVLFSRDGIISPLVFKFHSYPMISIYFPFIFPIYIYVPLFPIYFPCISHIFPRKSYEIPLFPMFCFAMPALRQQLAWMEVLRGRGYRGLPPLQKCAAAVATAVFRVKTEFYTGYIYGFLKFMV